MCEKVEEERCWVWTDLQGSTRRSVGYNPFYRIIWLIWGQTEGICILCSGWEGDGAVGRHDQMLDCTSDNRDITTCQQLDVRQKRVALFCWVLPEQLERKK